MSAVADTDDDVIGIDEIGYRVHRTRGQLNIWRGLPGFPEPRKTKYGHIGYSWRAVVSWMIANRRWIRHRAGDPSLDELVASVKTSVLSLSSEADASVGFTAKAVADHESVSPTSSRDTAIHPHATATYASAPPDRRSSARACVASDLRETD